MWRPTRASVGSPLVQWAVHLSILASLGLTAVTEAADDSIPIPWYDRIELTDSTMRTPSNPESLEVWRRIGHLSREVAFALLLRSSVFTIRAGIAGAPSDQAKALNVILDDPSAKGALLALYRKGTYAAKLYALCGLYLKDESIFEQYSKELEEVDTEIEQIRGCIGSGAPVSEIVEGIRRGVYPKALESTREQRKQKNSGDVVTG